MNEKPILFNTEMVQAVLDGRKTQTRREVKIPAHLIERQSRSLVTFEDECGDQNNILDVCPFGKVGDRLWVREAWHYEDWTDNGQPYVRYKSTGDINLCFPPEDWNERLLNIWEALSDPENYNIKNKASDQKWRPSIHMPRWASRITLEITDTRIERLQDISEQDAKVEGARKKLVDDASLPVWSYREGFKNLWDSTYKNWDKNPWVWVVEFKAI